MQNKEIINESAFKVETDSNYAASLDRKDVKLSSFKKTKKKDRESSAKDSLFRYHGEGVLFKAKLIGVEPVPDARGDKMCQNVMQKLKLKVKQLVQHKKKITLSISLQGIKIKDERNENVIYYHPVSLISFISQDITDARVFGYVFGSTDEQHRFIAIKTEKPAFHVVVAIRDLFQAVLHFQQDEIKPTKEEMKDIAKPAQEEKSETEETNKVKTEKQPNEENIYFEVLLQEPMKLNENPDISQCEQSTTVDNLLWLDNDIEKLEKDIDEMELSMAADDVSNSVSERDPFDTSFVVTPERDYFSIPQTATTTPLNVPVTETSLLESEDKYAAFKTIPSVLESSAEYSLRNDPTVEPRKIPPPKPSRSYNKTPLPESSLFSDLDPFGKDGQQYHEEFFQNSPEKDYFSISQTTTTTPLSVPDTETGFLENEDKYAAFKTIPSVFDSSAELEDSLRNDSTEPWKTPPAKPSRSNITPLTEPSLFSDLDPLGKDKMEFFQNPPKKENEEPPYGVITKKTIDGET